MPSNREVITAGYEAFNAGEFESVLAIMHPDVDWPNAYEGGRIQGRDNVREYWKRQLANAHSHLEPLRIEEDESGHVLVEVHQVVQDNTGKVQIDRMVCQVYSLRGGLITRMDIRDAGSPASAA